MVATLERNDRLRVYLAGGITGGLMGTPVDITVDQLSDEGFERAKQIIKLLTSKTEELTQEEIADRAQIGNNGIVGDFGYYVQAGDNGTLAENLSTIFSGSFRKTPKVVEELKNLLDAHAKPEDQFLKP